MNRYDENESNQLDGECWLFSRHQFQLKRGGMQKSIGKKCHESTIIQADLFKRNTAIAMSSNQKIIWKTS